MAWKMAEKVAALKIYFREQSAGAARRAFRRELGWRRVPTRATLLRWVAAFETSGSVATRSHTPRSRVPSAKVLAIKRAIRRSPRLSISRLAHRTGVPRSTVHDILRRQLRLFPFKLQLMQRIKRGDKAKRLRFCKWALGKWASRTFRKHLVMSDEAIFSVDGTVNKQNCRVWGTENPHAVEVHEAQSPSVTVWCGVCRKGILGPFFFEEAGRPVSVTASRYFSLLRDKVMPTLENLELPRERVWFQQDGAAPHTATSVLALLQETFPGKTISKGADVPWPPRSPDLSICDFFLWGHIKHLVYGQPVRSVRQLKQRIRAAVTGVPASMLNAAFDNLPLRLRSCRHRRGGHIEFVTPHS